MTNVGMENRLKEKQAGAAVPAPPEPNTHPKRNYKHTKERKNFVVLIVPNAYAM